MSRTAIRLRDRTGRGLVRFLLPVFSACFVGVGHADDASVLPKGVWRWSVDSKFYLPIDKRFGPDGDTEDVAVDYNRPLDSRVFTALAPLQPFVSGLPSIGDSVVTFEYDLIFLDLALLYGVTDRLTVGVNIPYRWITNNVNARLDSSAGSSANVGKNPLFGAPGQPPFIPLALGGIRLSTEDVQALLGRGLDVNGDGTIDIPGFGYKRFETFSDHGLGDLEAGFRYQYLKTQDWRLAFTGGVRFPTGQVDDPDSLTDAAFGSGAYALLFRLNNDYVLSNLWQARTPPGAPGELVLNATFRYDLVLPDRETLRVPDSVNNPITANKEKVDRDLGDRFEFEVSARYAFPFLSGSSGLVLYKYGFKLEDEISGEKGFAYESLEQETASTEHIFIGGLSYSTVPLYADKKFPVPLALSLLYRNRFAGSNNYMKAQYIGLVLDVFF